MSVPASLDRLCDALASKETASSVVASRPGSGGRPASVLALFFEDPDADESGPAAGLRIVVVEKTGRLRNHAGQIAFPGGGREDGESPRDAALRESWEEAGIDPRSVTVLGELPAASVVASGYDVTTVVGWWENPTALEPQDADEIAAVHLLSVPELIDPVHRATFVLGTHSGPTFLAGDLFIWGLTGALLSGLIDIAGWSIPWDASRRLEVPQRFLRG